MEPRPAAVVTPEAVPLDLETASIGSRFLALVILEGLLTFNPLIWFPSSHVFLGSFLSLLV